MCSRASYCFCVLFVMAATTARFVSKKPSAAPTAEYVIERREAAKARGTAFGKRIIIHELQTRARSCISLLAKQRCQAWKYVTYLAHRDKYRVQRQGWDHPVSGLFDSVEKTVGDIDGTMRLSQSQLCYNALPVRCCCETVKQHLVLECVRLRWMR